MTTDTLALVYMVGMVMEGRLDLCNTKEGMKQFLLLRAALQALAEKYPENMMLPEAANDNGNPDEAAVAAGEPATTQTPSPTRRKRRPKKTLYEMMYEQMIDTDDGEGRAAAPRPPRAWRPREAPLPRRARRDCGAGRRAARLWMEM